MPLAVYAATLAPDLGSIDSGELAAVAATLGIAHPTGYPLYTLLGRIAVLLLPGHSPIERLNLLSAVLAAASALFVFLLVREIVRRSRPDAPPWASSVLALGAAWLWGAHPALWEQAIGNEVHALQAAFAAATLWLASRAIRAGGRGILLSAYMLGLALTNHLSILFLVPGLAAGAILDAARRKRSGRLVFAGLDSTGGFLAAGAALLFPLTLYLYLPIRSHQRPLLDWGDPVTVTRLLRHVGGAQYRVWLFASASDFWTNLSGFVSEIASPLSIPVLLAAAAGVFALARRDRPSLARFGLAFLVGTAWASGYAIHDIEPYYMVARLALLCLAAAGATILLPGSAPSAVLAGSAVLTDTAVSAARAAARTAPRQSKPSWQRRAARVWVFLPAVAALLLFGLRWSALDRRQDRFVRFYAESLLDQLPPRTILLSSHWDMVVSPLLYVQRVEGKRPDVTIVDPELLRRSWYFTELERIDPSLLAPIESRVKGFLEQLRLFEAGEPYDPRKIEERYRAVIAGISSAHRSERPIYQTPEVEPSFYEGWWGIPEAMAVRLLPSAQAAPPVDPLDAGIWALQARFVREPVRARAWRIPESLARSRIAFLEEFGRKDEAERWRSALARFDAIPIPSPEVP